MEARDSAGRRLRLVGSGTVALLALIGLLALVEKGPPPIQVYSGASPLNVGSLGTYDFFVQVRERYPATVVFRPADIRVPSGVSKCLYVVVSPERPYTEEEAAAVVEALRACSAPALLVADESTTSNTLLAAVGSSARVEGSLLLDIGTGQPYPEARFSVGGESLTVTLDIASPVRGGSEVVGYVQAAAVLERGGTLRPASRVPVAVRDAAGNFTVIVVGDGSIFLNQVARSARGEDYRRLAALLVDTLCGRDPSCYVMFDGWHYSGMPVSEALRRPAALLSSLSPEDVLWLIPLLVAWAIHPATWLPPALELLNRATAAALSLPEGFAAVALASLAAGYYALRRLVPRQRDSRLQEQVEREELATADVREAILSRRYRLTSSDFVRLYEMVDGALRAVVGYGLDDDRIWELAEKLLGRKRGARYVERMRKLHEKATGRRRLLPIVLSWHRAATSLIRESEELLRQLGTSLEEEKGVEYILMR
ncbi:MAG: hypothetical protein ABWW70_06010 [Thermoproteota archaeon]